MKPKSNKKKGMSFENKVKKTIASGSIWFSPLDLDYEKYCIEVKYTDLKGFRISLNLLEKIWNQALSLNKEPFLVIGVKRNDEQIFMLNCHVNLEKKVKQ